MYSYDEPSPSDEQENNLENTAKGKEATINALERPYYPTKKGAIKREGQWREGGGRRAGQKKVFVSC